MKSRERVMAALTRGTFDRLPIKRLAVAEVDRRLSGHFGVRRDDDLLDRLGHDFREIQPVYRGPAAGGLIFGSSHQLQPDTPTENILAMYDAAVGIQ